MHGERPRRRDVLRGIGGAGTVGVLGALVASGTTAARSATARTGSNGSEVFMGGRFIELGSRSNGAFGTENPPPDSFYGPGDSEGDSESPPGIGLYTDPDGFDSGNTERYEYFLGNEGFLAGYVIGGGGELGDLPAVGDNSSSVSDTSDLPTKRGPTVSPPGSRMTISTTNTFGSEINLDREESPDPVLEIEQVHTLDNGNRYFETDVTITNAGNRTVDGVRFARAANPTPGVAVGCDQDTVRTVVSSPPDDDETLVTVEPQNCPEGVSPPPLHYYATDARVRGVTDVTGPEALYPDQEPVLVPESDPTSGLGDDSFSESGEGFRLIEDPDIQSVGIVFEAGSLEPGQTASVTYYTAVTDDIDGLRRQLGSSSESDGDGARFSLVCDERGCREEALDGYERVELSNDTPDVGEEIELAVTVTNVGEASGAYFGELTDGFDSYGARRVELDPEERATLTYSVSFEEPGVFRMFLTGDHIVDIPVGGVPGF